MATTILSILVVIKERSKKGILISETKLGISGNLNYAYLFPTSSMTYLMGYFHEQPSSSNV